MSVELGVPLSSGLYEQALKSAAATHQPVEQVVAFWAEIGRHALASPDLTVQVLELVLRNEPEIDNDTPPREVVDHLWKALRDRARQGG
ncbi:hypothetical protein [uncultured Dechloromonas sp.]|uniref:TA system antitoxin ParD family protein n=1 Tax=uncultured Dechloromonas sp. TaxID=171719 RepID=UPI0025F979AF|nr:hypothetical protein [uncultured Dechloromonas sp.]